MIHDGDPFYIDAGLINSIYALNLPGIGKKSAWTLARMVFELTKKDELDRLRDDRDGVYAEYNCVQHLVPNRFARVQRKAFAEFLVWWNENEPAQAVL